MEVKSCFLEKLKKNYLVKKFGLFGKQLNYQMNHLQLLVDRELEKRDIWELQSQKPDERSIYPNLYDDSSHSTNI